MDLDQAPRNVGPDHRPILFETRHHILLKMVYFAWDDLNSEHIEILSILQIVQELLESTVDYCTANEDTVLCLKQIRIRTTFANTVWDSILCRHYFS